MKIKVKSVDWKETVTEDEILKSVVVKTIQKLSQRKDAKIGCVISCDVTTNGKTKEYLFNSYHILMAAGLKKPANRMKKLFKNQYGIDLSITKEHE